MKTLVVHAPDPSTDFLCKIYENKDWTIMRENISKSKLRKAIIAHDRIIMLGHGTEYGLIGFDKYIIDSTFVQFLREKEIVAIWCNADVFVKHYGLFGFYTGMIISETVEANLYCVHATSKEIDESNTTFVNAIRKTIDDVPTMVNESRTLYDNSDNNVVLFNRDNLYYNPR